MKTEFDVTFENNSLLHPITGFDGFTQTGGTVELTAGSAYAGSYGLALTTVQYRKLCGLKYIQPTQRLRQRFYLNPNTLSIPTNGFYLARSYFSDASHIVYGAWLGYTAPNFTLSISLQYGDPGGGNSNSSSAFNISTGWNKIEIDWLAANPGFLKIYLGDILQRTLTGVDNSQMWVCAPTIGVTGFHNYNYSGIIYLDNWKANSDGTAIGD